MIAPALPTTQKATRPSLVARVDFLAASASPFLRRAVRASSNTPLDSVKAFLQSMIPAPVFSRRSLIYWFISIVASAMLGYFLGAHPFLHGLRLLRRGDLGSRLAFQHLAFRLSHDGGLAGLVSRTALGYRVGDDAAEKLDGPGRVVIAWNRMIDKVGIAVRVAYGHDGDIQAPALGHRQILLHRVDHEKHIRNLA